jgi:hypothetical protein
MNICIFRKKLRNFFRQFIIYYVKQAFANLLGRHDGMALAVGYKNSLCLGGSEVKGNDVLALRRECGVFFDVPLKKALVVWICWFHLPA